MERLSQYQQILSESFSQFIPEWAQLSPSDPMKVFAEAMSSSLSAIETRQRRLGEVILDSIPALLGFDAKPGELPMGYVRFAPFDTGRVATEVGPQNTIRFEYNERMLYARPAQRVTVLPLKVTREEKVAPGFVTEIDVRGDVAALPLLFIATGPNASMRSFELEVSREGSTRLVPASELRVIDKTHRLEKSGTIEFSRFDGDSLFVEGDQVKLTVRTESSVPMNGTLNLNTGLVQILDCVETLEIAHIKGEPWEKILLPQNLVEIPEQLSIQFPDDKRERVTRLEKQALRERVAGALRNHFFYNAADHSIVLPCADELVSRFNGGVTLILEGGVFQPSENWIPEAARSIPDASRLYEKAEPICLVRAAIPRESQDDMLARFYELVSRLQNIATPVPALNFEDLAQDMLKLDSRIRRVEVVADDAAKRAVFHVLTWDAEGRSVSAIDEECLAKVSEALQSKLPLAWKWNVRSFVRKGLELHLDSKGKSMNLSGVLSVARGLLGVPPYGQLLPGATVQVDAIASGTKLVAKWDGGEFTDAVSRAPGEWLDIQLVTGGVAYAAS